MSLETCFFTPSKWSNHNIYVVNLNHFQSNVQFDPGHSLEIKLYDLSLILWDRIIFSTTCHNVCMEMFVL